MWQREEVGQHRRICECLEVRCLGYGGYKAGSAKGWMGWGRTRETVHPTSLCILFCTRLENTEISNDCKRYRNGSLLVWKQEASPSQDELRSENEAERILLSKRENSLCICLCKECSRVRTLVVANDRSLPGTTLDKQEDLLAHAENPGKGRDAADFWE